MSQRSPRGQTSWVKAPRPTSRLSMAAAVGVASLVLALPLGAQDAAPAFVPAAPTLAPSRVLVVADKKTRPYREATAGVTGNVAGGAKNVEVVPVAKAAARMMGPPVAGEIVIALGPKSASMLAKSSKRGAAALVRRSEAPPRIPSVTVDVPPTEQIPWIRQAFPGRSRVVILQGKADLDVEALRALAPTLRFSVVAVDRPENAVFALKRALEVDRDRTVVWLLPDSGVITANTIGPLAQQALSARVPIVGFSGYFLRVGALAAVQTDYRKMGSAALATAQHPGPHLQIDKSRTIKTDKRVVLSPPGAFLAVNAKLAARLGIAVRDGKGVVFE